MGIGGMAMTAAACELGALLLNPATSHAATDDSPALELLELLGIIAALAAAALLIIGAAVSSIAWLWRRQTTWRHQTGRRSLIGR